MYTVIMAGGSGTRFWPLSREVKSKQFLSLFRKKSLLQTTLSRFRGLSKWEHIFIVANLMQKDLIKEQAPKVPQNNILFEPIGKNTAPCIGLAAVSILEKDPDGVLIVTPADHLVLHQKKFKAAIRAAEKVAVQEKGLVTIGIKPDRPATGYGYVQTNQEILNHEGVHAYHVKTFAEKPNLDTAQRFLESGDFLWNSGIFVFRADIYLEAVAEHLPDLYEGLMEVRLDIRTKDFKNTINRIYQQIKSVSIDYGILEKSKNVFVVKGDFGWNDLGSWEQVYLLHDKDSQGNAVTGNTVLVDTSGSFVHSSKGLIGIIGMEDIIVVQAEDTILICPRDRAEDVRRLVERIKRNKLCQYA